MAKARRSPASLKAPPALFELGAGVVRPAATEPYDALRAQHEALASHDEALERTRLPAHRKLRIYTQDPATPRMNEPEVELQVPYEPLPPGPAGSTIVVTDVNESTGETYEPVRLDDQALTLTSGLKPSTTDPRFAQQMTYALAAATYERFRVALGRDPQFAFDPHEGDAAPDGHPVVKLHVRPHAFEEDNAYYDPDLGALCFGYTRATDVAQGLSQPGTIIFTALSHDVVIHETSHAMLDGLRARFMLPTNPDVDGFHEGFADLIALFQRFSYRPLLERALTDARGRVTSALLVDLARQWGAATSDGKTPLRTALLAPGELDEPVPAGQRYSADMEAHDMGAVLMRAVFDAFRFVFDQKTATLRSLGPEGDRGLPPALVELLAGEASRLADQFLSILIRAVDYCPPVDLRLGEYLRALITADYDLVPDDPWGYREALVRGFRRHGITVEGVLDLTEDALLWRGPERRLPPVTGLALANEPKRDRKGRLVRALTEAEARVIRGTVIGYYVTRADRLYYFGLATPSRADRIERPVVESVRAIRRVGPDGNLNRDYVAEVVQRRRTRGRWFYGGSTIILNAAGVIRYIIAKNVKSSRRETRMHRFLAAASPVDRAMIEEEAMPQALRFRRLHAARNRPARGA